MTWNHQEIAAIEKLLKSNEQLTMGENVKLFEQEFAKFMNSKYAVMVNSGSSANLLAVASLFFCKNPLHPGDEVIVPAVSWATTYSPLQQYGLKLKFVDVDIDTLNIDLNQLRQAITARTRLIVGVNIVGNPIEYNELKEIIGDRNIRVLEDNCESMGAELDGKQAGTFGILGTFSTYFSHHISTIEGGMIVTDDEELYHILLSIRSHGWTRHLPDPNKICLKNKDSFYNLFDFILPGYNVRPTEIAAVIGIEQLKKLPSIVKQRRLNADKFKELFSGLNVRIQKETGKSSWFGFAIILPSKHIRSKFIQCLTDENVECRPIVAGNFCRNSVIKYFDHSVFGQLENSDIVHDCGIYVSNSHLDISETLEKIQKITTSILNAVPI
ncbi:MAG: DegT/DnrJ/EryC1/StrS family aminotransferase [Cetobacterium sp.]